MSLAGQRVLVTGLRGERLAKAIEAAGGEAALMPLIEIAPIRPNPPLDGAIERLSGFRWLVFSSANGARLFGEAAQGQGKSPGQEVVAVGKTTAEALAACGFPADHLPEESSGKGIAKLIASWDVRGQRALFPCAKIHRPAIPEAFRQGGADLLVVPVYETRHVVTSAGDRRSFVTHPPDAALFTSPSAVASYAENFGAMAAPMLRRVRPIAIGPTTAGAFPEHGLPKPVIAHEPSIEGILAALAR